MRTKHTSAEVNIHLRAKAQDRLLIDHQAQARQDFSRKLKWIRPILAAKNDLAINAGGGPRSSSVRHGSRNDLTPCQGYLIKK